MKKRLKEMEDKAASGEKLIGRFEVSLDSKAAETKTCLAHNCWVNLGTNSNKKMKKSGSDPELHIGVRFEPDPRFVFQFDGEPECSPQVFQVQGNTKQAVFTCKFGFRNSGDQNLSPRIKVEGLDTIISVIRRFFYGYLVFLWSFR